MASESYTEALNALVATTGSVAHVDDLPIKCEYGGNYPVKLEKKLLRKSRMATLIMLPHRHRHF